MNFLVSKPQMNTGEHGFGIKSDLRSSVSIRVHLYFFLDFEKLISNAPLRFEDFGSRRQRVNAFFIHFVSQPDAGRSRNGSLRRDFDGRRDDVFRPVTFRRRDIAWQDEAGQRGHVNVVRAANPRFEHAAAPDRNPAFVAIGLNFARFGVAADATEFDVDDAASA